MDGMLKKASVYVDGKFVLSDYLLFNGTFVPCGTSVPTVPVYDCSSCVILPGFVDVHVHLREPGFSYKETIASGTRAAARGGYTCVCAMPNLAPVPDSVDHLQQELQIIEKDAVVSVLPYGAITCEEGGQKLAALEEMADAVVGFSDDGHGVQDDDMMRLAMRKAKKLGKIIVAHCEDNALLHGGYIHDGTYAKEHGHRGICSQSEWGQIERDLELVRQTGCAYHICHVSTKESVALIRAAKREGLDVTCETGPHYLLLNDSMLEEDGRFKMNPPLRGRADQEALIEGILDGTIDMIATDHAPHSAEEKSRGLKDSAMGIVGLETAFALLYTNFVKPGVFSMQKLMELLHDAPCRRFGIANQMEKGNFTVFALDQKYQIDPEEFCSKGRATPFAGWQVNGRCLMTVAGGKLAWYDDSMKKRERF